MMTTALNRGVAETVPRVIWFSVAFPRRAVRELLSAANVDVSLWWVAILGVVVPVLAKPFFTWIHLVIQSTLAGGTSVFILTALSKSLKQGLISILATVVFVLLYVLIWNYVFGFRNKSKLVWVATAVSLALGMVSELVLRLLAFVFGLADESNAFIALTFAQIAGGFMFYASYYAESLAIGFGKALLLALGAMMIIAVTLSAIAIAFLHFSGIGSLGTLQ